MDAKIRDVKGKANINSPQGEPAVLNNQASFQLRDNRASTHTFARYDRIASSALQRRALNSSRFGNEIIQRAVNVAAAQDTGVVTITANGTKNDFQGGDPAGNHGWNGVEQYRARASIGGHNIISNTYNNNYLVAQSGHVLAQQNGGLGSDPDNVFAQDGGVNNGPYRTEFENPMRTALNAVAGATAVSFRAELFGENISKGELKKNSGKVHVDLINDKGAAYDAARILAGMKG